MADTELKYKKKDFMSDQDIKWCPGCGDYSILAGVQKAMPEIGVDKEKIVFISGIGCAARFPYYMNTYGFHTIHGRAPALASGLKIMNPELSVWVISGDGDSLSIGGNHLLHTLRRNVDLNILLFNNEIYGLTKGQVSPTSAKGTVSKSSPFGSLSAPVQPLTFAFGANATFIARSADILAKHLQATIKASHAHKGASFVEIMQNCHIFNDGVFKDVLDKQIRDDRLIQLEAGKPMIFGKDSQKALVLDKENFVIKVVSLADVGEKEILVHDPEREDPTLHFMLARMQGSLPLAVGVIRAVKKPTLDEQMEAEKQAALKSKGRGKILDLLHQAETWTVN